MTTEQEIREKIQQHPYTIYLDECGAGPLCGDLVICSMVLPKKHTIQGLDDSKKLTEKKRELLFPNIIKQAIEYQIIRISPKEVDSLNIFQARMEGFRRAIADIKSVQATYAVVDGNKIPSGLNIECDYLIEGDGILEGISAASIVAKVTRDREIVELSKIHPYSLYGLEKHKGYGTKIHMEALEKHGPIKDFHRFSYKPVQKSIKQ